MNERILFIKLDPKTEEDIIRWIKSLPTRTINKTLNEIVVAESKGQTARIPCKISYTKNVEPLRCRLIFKSKAAINFLSKIPKGEYKSILVKIIRRHIQVNKTLPPAPFEINIKYLSMAIDSFVRAIKNKRWESKCVPHRFDKLNAFYEFAFKDFSNAILECYKSADRNHGDYNLCHLDTDDIVNKAFASVFGEITDTANKSVSENSVKASKGIDTTSAKETRSLIYLSDNTYGISSVNASILAKRVQSDVSDFIDEK